MCADDPILREKLNAGLRNLITDISGNLPDLDGFSLSDEYSTDCSLSHVKDPKFARNVGRPRPVRHKPGYNPKPRLAPNHKTITIRPVNKSKTTQARIKKKPKKSDVHASIPDPPASTSKKRHNLKKAISDASTDDPRQTSHQHLVFSTVSVPSVVDNSSHTSLLMSFHQGVE